MEAILAGLILAPIIVVAVPLAILRAGIRRQEHAASLAEPAGLAAALARHVCGLHAVTAPGDDRPGPCDVTPLLRDGKEARSA